MNKNAKYKQFSVFLLNQIISGKYKIGDKLPSERSLAVKYNIAHMTVNKALNGLVSAGYLVRRPPCGTFVADYKPIRVKRKICLLVNSNKVRLFQSNTLENQLYSKMSKYAANLGITLVFVEIDNLESEINAFSEQKDFELSGVVCVDFEKEELLKYFIEKYPSTRFFMLNYRFSEVFKKYNNFYEIYNNDYVGGQKAADYLFKRGHREFAIISYEQECLNFSYRVKGAKNRLKELGISPEAINIRFLESFHSIKADGRLQAAQIVHDLLEDKPKITGFLTVNDYFASGIVAALNADGVLSKREVVGYDNIVPELAQLGVFATVSIDFESIGRCAMNCLIEKSPDHFQEISPRIIRPVDISRWTTPLKKMAMPV